MSELKEVQAVLNISVNVDCPHCGYYIDLLDTRDTNNIPVNDDNLVMSQACPSGGIWIDSHEKFEIEEVQCGECKRSFSVQGMEW
jgi:hypothetical protein